MPSPIPETEPRGSNTATPDDRTATVASGRAAGDAAQGPIPEAVSAAGSLATAMPGNPSAQAVGRRILSTAFVRIGPDGHLTVSLHDGRALVLRDVVMRPDDYCGTQASGAKYCGSYDDVATARPGGGPAAGETGQAASGRGEQVHGASPVK